MRFIQFSTQVHTGWYIYIVHHILEYFQKNKNKNIKADVHNQSNHRAYREVLSTFNRFEKIDFLESLQKG